jgi:hypothetical protein
VLVLAGCRDARGPVAPAVALPRFSGNTPGTYGVVHATVYAPNGAPAAGYVVTVVNRAQGPFRIEGVKSSYTGALTAANGTTTISGLPVPGEYCVVARPLTSIGTATSFGSFFAPLPTSNSSTPAQSANGAGVIGTGPSGPSIALTPQNFQDYCYQGGAQAAPLVLTFDVFSASVRLDLQPAGTLQLQFLDLNGQPTPTPAWVLEGIAPPPWMQDFTLPPGIRPGVLLSTGPAVNGVVNLNGIPAGPLTVESGILNPPGQGPLTFTLNLTSTGGNQVIPPITLEPLLCTLNRHTEAAGDAGGGVDFVGYVKDGFRAEFGPPLHRLNQLGLFYGQVTDGAAQLDIRVWIGNADYHLVARYSVTGTAGVLLQQSGPAYALGVRATPFFAPQADGSMRVSWTITGLPSGMTAIDYNLAATVDQFPDAVAGQRQFQTVPIPSTCAGGQSNDDQWWLN